MTDVLLGALVPIFVVMGLGYFAGWIRDIDNHHVAELNALVMDFAVPAALFVPAASVSRRVLLTPIIGVAFSLIGIRLPDFVSRAFQLIGQASGGVALFLTGLILSSQRLLLSSNVITSTLLKNVAQPLLTLGLVVLLTMTHDTLRATLLLMALQSGFFGVLFGLRYGVESQEAGSTLIASWLLSVVTLTIVFVFTASL